MYWWRLIHDENNFCDCSQYRICRNLRVANCSQDNLSLCEDTSLVRCRNEFIINLTNGPRVEKEEENDTLDNRLLVIRASISQRRIYLNACIGGEWGREGSVKHKWAPGDEFDIRIRCHDKFFEIFIDHKLVAKFAYYVPISNITHIYINGDAELYSVSWEGKYYQIPYAADIPGNFYPGRKLYISAVTKKRAKQSRLLVDHLQRLIRNTRSEERWGKEENSLKMSFPFRKKRAFDLLFFCDEDRFVCYVDDCLIGSYTHRMSPRDIDKLCIDGDVELQGVHLK
ncbi:unnamed protein product [Gongylonema pulchrum]|uniref:Galectin n=1 Tax=Gongylonema pulchrum TaxID=637853 RepID=A0A183DVW3_9BILA|nr:unnamed protein product [Gongylonema pulchrum]